MNQLIKVNFDTQTVSARELHKALGIEKRFSAWFEINSQGFICGEDYSNPYLKVRVQNEGSREVQREVEDYDLSIDMAKHICLMSRTEKGKQCRQYLIDLEKAWNTPEQVMARALRMADKMINTLTLDNQKLQQEVEEKDKQIEQMKPKASYYDLILQCKDLISATVIAQDYGMTAQAFNKLLQILHIQYKLSGVWVLYRDYKDQGYTGTKTYNYADSEAVQHAKEHTYWTQKGRKFLYEKLKDVGYLPVMEQ